MEHVDFSNLADPDEYELSVVEHDFITEDNFKIHAYEVVVDNPQGVVIMLSGITGPSVTHYYGQAKLVSQIGFASILIDARGHGKSDGDKVTIGVHDVKDVDVVVDYIKQSEVYGDLPLVIMGTSMGGATAINAASLNDDIDGLISMSAFSSWTDVCVDTVVESGFPRWVGKMFIPSIHLHGLLTHGPDFFKIVPEKTIRQIGDKPILFIHSRGDVTVPIDNLYRLLANYEGDNATVVIRESDDHMIVKDDDITDPFQDEEYCEMILTFLQQFVS